MMTPEEQAIKDVDDLVIDIYKELFSWIPSWIGKKVVSSKRAQWVAKRVMNISKRYVEAKNIEQDDRIYETIVSTIEDQLYGK